MGVVPDEERLILLKLVVVFSFTYGALRGFCLIILHILATDTKGRISKSQQLKCETYCKVQDLCKQKDYHCLQRLQMFQHGS